MVTCNASDHLIAAELFNFVVIITKLAKDGFRVLPERRDAIEARRAIGKTQRASDDGNWAHRRFHFSNHLSRDDLRVSQNLSDPLNFPIWQAALLEPAEPFVVRTLLKNPL